MNERPPDRLLPRRAAEIGFAVLLLGFGGLIVRGALDLETGWGSSGPEAGYFPFRVGGLLMLVATLILLREAMRTGWGEALLDRTGAINILRFVLPLAGFVAGIPFAGLYLAAMIYLLLAIGVVGRGGWRAAFGGALLAPFALFLLFEFVFRTPLPKGPLGPLLGMI